jgi:hypothetical protein
MGAGGSKGINLSAIRERGRSLELWVSWFWAGVWASKEIWFWPVVAAKKETVDCWFLGASET